MDRTREDAGPTEVTGPLTWSASVIALLYGVTMFFVPYEFERGPYKSLVPFLPELSLLFILSGILLLVPQLLPVPAWLDLAARIFFVIPLGWLLVVYAIAEWLPTAIVSFGLFLFFVPLEPFVLRRKLPPFRWCLTLFSLSGLSMVLWPGTFFATVYGLPPPGIHLLGISLMLSGLALVRTMRRPLDSPARAAAELVSGALIVVYAVTLVWSDRWLGAEFYGVLGFFGMLLPFLPRLRDRIRTRLAKRLIRAFTLAVLPPLFVLAGVTHAVMQRALREQVFASNAALATGSAAFVRQYVQDGQAAALMVARQPALRKATTTWEVPLIEEQLRLLYEESGLFRGLWQLDAQGLVRAVYPRGPKMPGRDLAGMPFFTQTVHSRLPTLGHVIQSDLAGRPLVVPFAIPMEDDEHRLLGVLVAVLDLRGLSEQLGAIRVGHLGRLHLVDEQGRIIGHPDPARLGFPMDDDDLGARLALAGRSGVQESPTRQQLVAYEYVPDLGWGLVAELPTHVAYQPLTRMTVVFLLLLVAVALATIGVASIISLRITDPLLTLQETARALSLGDLGRRTALATGDELEDLAHGFDRMAGELQHLVEKLTTSERSLLRMNSELRAVLDSVDSAVLVFDHGHRIRYANRRVQGVLGLASSEVLGQPIDRITTALAPRLAAPEAFRARLSRLAENPQERSQEELALREPWGVLMHFSSPVFLGETVLGRIDVYDDITQVRQLEQLKKEFLLLVSHEFRTPLTFATLNTEAALRMLRLRGDVPPELIHCLEQARAGERRLIVMVEELLDVAAIDAGQLKLHPEELSLPALVHEVMKRLTPRLENHHLVLELPAELPCVTADRRRITQVITNFLGNAAQYTPPGTEIHVRLRREGGQVVFSVTDRGAGLAPEELSHLFNRFYRARELVGQAKEGLGLGLFLNKAFIEAHAGRLWVETARGQGATFAFSLPVSSLTQAPSTALQEPHE